jgi:hypothetical protein
MNEAYINTVRLLLDVAPVIIRSPHFAMKGGTALNLFVQDMPRLSVDIDVVFMDHRMSREEALEAIATELRTAQRALQAMGYRVMLPKTNAGDEVKMLVEGRDTQVKVEVNFVFRGALHPAVSATLSRAAQDLFTTTVTVPVLATCELYGSKLVAAMDRQHPRDLFDVHRMFEQFATLTDDVVECFVAYLAGHNRPVHEVLFCGEQPIEHAYATNFEGLTREPVPLDKLVSARRRLYAQLPRALTSTHREFLFSLVKGNPDWSRMPFPHLADLPALRWKLMNLAKLKKASRTRFNQQYDELAKRFDALDSL